MASLEDAICEIIDGVWSSVLGLLVTRSAGTLDDPALTGCVQVTGAWQGAVVLRCATGIVDRAATIVFDTHAATQEQLHDVLAELANMVGGNIKALMAEPSRLSLPTIVDGASYLTRVPGSHPVAEVTFECDGHRFLVTVLEQDPDQPTAAT
jgi:chemotaxis protein CheX